VLHVSLDGSRAVDLPFTLPDGPAPVELPPDTRPMLEGHTLVASWHIGGPNYDLPPELINLLGNVDAVTVTIHQRYDAGQLVPNIYEVAGWMEAVTDGG
jgi:hypothetical protein